MLLIILLFINVNLPAQDNLTEGLKAILIVGHQEDGTAIAISEMNKIAQLFESNNIKVYKFYDKKAKWEDIVKVSNECSFLVYSGHGTRLGENKNVGGLCVEPTVSSSEIIAGMKLKKNALVVFKSVCNGAGSSASDDKDIGIAEAKKRVMHYANPFFKIGAAAYYANNYGNGAYNFISAFLKGESIQQGYTNSTKIWTTVEFEAKFPKDTSKNYSIASSKGGGTATKITYTNGVKKVEKVVNPKSYDIAYVGRPLFTIREMK